MEGNLNFLNWKTTSFLFKWKMALIFLGAKAPLGIASVRKGESMSTKKFETTIRDKGYGIRDKG